MSSSVVSGLSRVNLRYWRPSTMVPATTARPDGEQRLADVRLSRPSPPARPDVDRAT